MLVAVPPLQVHMLFEGLAYLAAVLVHVALRKRRGDVVTDTMRLEVLAGAAVGAAIGSRLLAALAEPPFSPLDLIRGKTIVGGIIGGWIGVEVVKRLAKIRPRTGDLFVFPLMVAMVIGRIGCFLAGPVDHTAGKPSNLPWAIAMGDPVRRHPVALYEIAFVLAFAPLVELARRRGSEGDAFRFFVAGYMLFRFFVDFLKPDPPPVLLGITVLQAAALAAAAVCVFSLAFRTRRMEVTA
jgi:prolipoprotein diacylglyceryltransferase